MANALDSLAPPSSNPLDALPPPKPSQYPGLDQVPGFRYVKPGLDLAAGAGGALADHAVNVIDLLRKIPGAYKVLPDTASFHKAIADATPDNTPAHVGSFLEGTTEFMVPAGRATAATRVMRLAARTAAQAGVGAGVSAIQSKGDPASIAAGAALGGGSELAGAAINGAKNLLANKAPTLANWAESFGNATPTQKARISRALDVLGNEVPPESVHETQDLIKGKLDDLGQAYQNLDPAIKAREVDPADVVAHLEDLQKQYTRRGVVTDPAAYSTIGSEIKKVEAIAMKNGGAPAPKPSGLVGLNGQPLPPTGAAVPGKVNVDDIIHLKQNANGRTNFNSPDADKSLWRGIGDAYRSAADTLAPETTPLNREYQKYKDLEQIIDQNIARGKGTTPSGLTALGDRMAHRGMGAAAGASIGGAVAGAPGAAVGSVAGGIFGPKVGKAAARALQNAVDSGAFKSLAPAKQAALRGMAAIGDNAGILKLLGVSATEESAAGQ